MVIFLYATTTTFAPMVEGRFYPVTESMQIARVQSAGDTHVRIWGAIRKVRECEFHHVEWYIGEPGGPRVRVDVEFEEPSKARPAGNFTFGPWRVHVTQRQLFERSFAKVYHNCHGFWLTETDLFP